MTLNIAINGFGRIGRNVLRAIIENDVQDVNVVAINDLAPASTLAHLLQFDSVHGRLNADIQVEDDAMVINGKRIALTAIRNPEELPWDGVDIAYECTGIFTARDKAATLLKKRLKARADLCSWQRCRPHCCLRCEPRRSDSG